MNEPDPRPWHGPKGEWLVVLQFVIFFAFILVPRWASWASPSLLDATVSARTIVWWLCGACALAMASLGALQIRNYLTPLPYPVDHSQLVTGGVYRLVRHPLYGSQLIAALGWVCYTLSVSHLILFVLGFWFFDYKASAEERWLKERHPEYAAYARKTHKLIPFLY